MSREQLVNRIAFVMTDEERRRITVSYESTGKLWVRYDPHGLAVKKAEKDIKNIIAMSNDEFVFVIIHGFNHGTAIKDMIHRELLSERVKNKHCLEENPGVTVLDICSRTAA